MDYLDQAIRNDMKPSADSPMDPKDVLRNAIQNPGFAPVHLLHLIELAKIKIAREKEPAERLEAFYSFTEDLIKLLKHDQRSADIAKLLNNEVGLMFDNAFLRWNQLSESERKTYSSLLGSTMILHAGAESFARVMLFFEKSTPTEFYLFANALKYSAGAYALPPSPSDAHIRFVSELRSEIKRLPLLEGASTMLGEMKKRDFSKSSPWNFWSVDWAEMWFSTVFESGNPKMVDEALTLLEKTLPIAEETLDSIDKPVTMFADVLQRERFKFSLVAAERRYREFADRIHAVQSRIVKIRAMRAERLAELHLARISTHEAQVIHGLKQGAYGFSCRDLLRKK